MRSHDRILHTALELFATKGYESTSVREICEGAGLTKPTLYHFYRSKEGVYRALVDDALENFRTRLVALVSPPGTTRERLKRMARGYFEAAFANRERVRFIFGLVHNPASCAPATDFPRFYQSLLAPVAQAVEEGVSRGELSQGPIEARMLVFMGALGESLVANLLTGRPPLTPELADGLVDTILDGWTASPAPANHDGRS